MELVPTERFEHGSYPFENFNYLQSLCYPYHNKDVNQVVSAATSAGKTIVAEINIAYINAQGKKAIFLSPLKAVTQERYDSWTDKNHYFSSKKIEILTGDHKLTPAKTKKIQEADIVLLTSEMLDTRTRYINNSNNGWLTDVGVVVADEAHLLATSRGPALEVGLMRFTKYNPDAKVILLSATMSNLYDLDEWLTNLNGKKTQIIETSWRPVDLEEHYIRTAGADSVTHRTKAAENILNVLTCPMSKLPFYFSSSDPALRNIAEVRGKGIRDHNDSKEPQQTLVFVHGKEEGKKLNTSLNKSGITSEFHSADLTKQQRNKIENKFKSGELKILIATSTLAWGINMPARYVIIMGNKRGFQPVNDMDIKQMIGRAGRFGMYDKGDAFIVCNESYELCDKFEIDSYLGDKDILIFHLIAEVYAGNVKTKEEAKEWYKRSLASVQTQIDLVERTLDSLVDLEALRWSKKDGYKVTAQGKIARDLYLSPSDIQSWKNNFFKLAEYGSWDKEADVAWALTANIRHFNIGYTPKELKSLVRTMMLESNLLRLGSRCEAFAAMFFYRLIRGSNRLDQKMIKDLDIKTSAILAPALRDLGRVFSALQRLNQLEKWNREKDLFKIKAKITYGVGDKVLELISIPGVGEKVAYQLYNAGFRTLEDVKKNKEFLNKYIPHKASVTRILKGLDELDKSNFESTL